jgi:hypothetical protein
MATGDASNILPRIVGALPPWFGASGAAPVRDALLAGPATLGAWLYGQIEYIRAQTRIATASGAWLDLIAADFFGRRIRRRPAQSDAAMRTRILAEVVRPRGTRPALRQVLRDLTGQEPVIFEPTRPADTGALSNGTMALGVAGCLGTRALPAQMFVTVPRGFAAGNAYPATAGLGLGMAALNVGTLALAGTDTGTNGLTDADLFSAIDSVRPAGVTVWARMTG